MQSFKNQSESKLSRWIFNRLAQFTLTFLRKFYFLYLQSSLANSDYNKVEEHLFLYSHIQCLFLVALYKWHDWMCFIEDAATQVILVCCQTILGDDKKEQTLESYVILRNWATINLRKMICSFQNVGHFHFQALFIFTATTILCIFNLNCLG